MEPSLFTVAYVTIAVLVTTFLVATRTVRGRVGGALVWAIFRAVGLGDVHWTFARHLTLGWVVVVAVLGAVAIGLADIRRRKSIRVALSWAALVVAIMAPFGDLFSAEFWMGWLQAGAQTKGAMILALIIIAAVATRWSRRWAVLPLVVAALAALLWGQSALFGTPTPTTSATTTTTSATTSAPATAYAVVSQIPVSWQQLKGLTTTGFQESVDKSKPETTVFDKSKTWSSSATNSQLVVAFVPASDMSDAEARSLVGASKTAPVVRVSGCYSTLEADQVCPTGDDGAILTVAATITDSKGVGVVSGWGLLVTPSGDGEWTVRPITYST